MHSEKRLLINRILTCPALLFLLGGCDIKFGPALRGSGVAKSETRDVGHFSEIEVGNAIRLDATTGAANALEVTTDDNLLPHVKTIVTGERLRIYVDGSWSTDLGIRVKATAPVLRALAASGAATTTLSGMAVDRFQLDLSGASSCQLTGDAELLEVTLSGASRATIAGEAKQLKAECSGASQLDAMELSAEKASVELSGASTGHVNVSEELAAEASGASTLRYAGEPPSLDKRSSGASTIETEGKNRKKGDKGILAEDPLE
jgi:hypothetical protein